MWQKYVLLKPTRLESIWAVLPKSNVFLKCIGFSDQIWFVNWRFDEFYTISILFQRKTEFRKLCDKLRNHLDLVLKQSTSPLTINLNNADTQQMNLDTRLVQLGKFSNHMLFRRHVSRHFSTRGRHFVDILLLQKCLKVPSIV